MHLLHEGLHIRNIWRDSFFLASGRVLSGDLVYDSTFVSLVELQQNGVVVDDGKS